MGILEGKNILVTGVLTEGSIAFDVARLCQEQGATVVLTGVGRTLKVTEAMGRRLPVEAKVVELDVTNPEQLATLADSVRQHVPHLDGVVHSIGFAPQAVLGGDFMGGTWEDVSVAIHISAFSLKALAAATLPLMTNGGSIVGLTFDGRFAWPVYDWMGVAKAAYEGINRYLARDLGPQGIRCNLVSAGPLKTTAAKHIPGFDQMESKWSDRAPLGWDSEDTVAAAKAVTALLSDWFPATTGEMIHVDGGVHAMGQ